jgi:hypothetical protein
MLYTFHSATSVLHYRISCTTKHSCLCSVKLKCSVSVCVNKYVKLPLRYNYVTLFWQCGLHSYINFSSHSTSNRLSKSFHTASPCSSSNIPSISVLVRRPLSTSSSVAVDDLLYFLGSAGSTAACRCSHLVRDFSLAQPQPYIV